VPSKIGREGAHPLEKTIRLGQPLAGEYRTLLTPVQPDLVDRGRSDDTAFAVAEDVAGKRILLIDDTFASGASLQSAASALGLAGATVIAGVPIGRVVDTSNPAYPEKLELWEQQQAVRFSFDVCCLERP
jgi:adenine/guanine phosphoribosyltransferase-like PRPP-binding protein